MKVEGFRIQLTGYVRAPGGAMGTIQIDLPGNPLDGGSRLLLERDLQAVLAERIEGTQVLHWTHTMYDAFTPHSRIIDERTEQSSGGVSEPGAQNPGGDRQADAAEKKPAIKKYKRPWGGPAGPGAG